MDEVCPLERLGLVEGGDTDASRDQHPWGRSSSLVRDSAKSTSSPARFVSWFALYFGRLAGSACTDLGSKSGCFRAALQHGEL